MEQRTCPVCGEQFTPTTHHQRFCPPTERDRMAASQARSRCARRWHNAKRSGADMSRPLIGPFDCAQCGKHCVPGERGIDPKATKYCSYRCKRVVTHTRPRRRAAAEAKLARAAIGKRGDAIWYDHRCPECGESTMSHLTPGPFAGFCSRRCGRRQLRRRRRAQKRGVGVGPVSFRMVAERDGWICGICDATVDGGLSVPHPLAPTLDHVVPLARGGSHTLVNAQLAHFMCNSLKRDLLLV